MVLGRFMYINAPSRTLTLCNKLSKKVQPLVGAKVGQSRIAKSLLSATWKNLQQ